MAEFLKVRGCHALLNTAQRKQLPILLGGPLCIAHSCVRHTPSLSIVVAPDSVPVFENVAGCAHLHPDRTLQSDLHALTFVRCEMIRPPEKQKAIGL